MRSALPLQDLATAIHDIAINAATEIMAVYDGDFDVREKDDQSPVTEADERAEQLILNALKQLDPSIPIVAEESVAKGDIPDVGDGPFWLVDPLDGTKEFVSRNGEFTVNIGLVEGDVPVLGVVYAPVPKRLFLGWGRDQAFTQDDGGTLRPIRAVIPDADGLVVVASRSHSNPETEAFLAKQNVRQITSAGSSLKFCLVAAGEADVYPRMGPTNEWDTAAGHAVLNAAGGSVRTLDGGDFLYRKPTFRNPPFVARGREVGA
jgi:3'(2'), 5'-bisphosphate nucleotidase